MSGQSTVGDFAGIDLVSTPDSSACIDQLNVDLDIRGAVRTRDGYDNFTSSELTNQPDGMIAYEKLDGTRQLIVGNGTRLDVLNTSGTSVANQTGLTQGPWSFTRFGTPSARYVFAGNGYDSIYYWDGSTWTSATLSGSHHYLAVTPQSNRLMHACDEDGTLEGDNPSSVRFTDPGDIVDASGDQLIDLDPGDGERIAGMVAWRDYVFVFKQSKFYVYYGESVDGTGGAVFNFRKVATGVGCVAGGAVAAARDGVYFLDRTGVYRTTGGSPQLVSRNLDPLFTGAAHSFYQGDEVSQTSISGSAMGFFNERIYLSVPTGASTTNNMTFVYDPRYDYWLVWNLGAAAFTSFRIGDTPELMIARPTGSNYIDRFGPSFTTDDGTAIVSRHRSGLYDLGTPGLEKRILRTRLWGSGTPTWKTSRNWDSLSNGQSVTLGTSPAVDHAVVPSLTKRGHLLSHEISATSGQWIVHGLTHEVDGPRVAQSNTP